MVFDRQTTAVAPAGDFLRGKWKMRLSPPLDAMLVLMVLAVAGVSAADPPAQAPDQVDFFERRVRPVLVEHCQSCHGEQKQEGGLRLDTRAGLLKGADSGPVILPGKPEESELILAIRQEGTVKMPPKKKLSEETIAALTTWVRQGASWPESDGGDKARNLAARKGAHWAFRPMRRTPVPTLPESTWPQTDIDRFILARLATDGLKPAPGADRHTLIRRATFDLTGLPPTPAEVAAFESDSQATSVAFAAVVNRLLDSPRYGERWGRYWLDVARYADNKGYVFFEEQTYPWAYTYRDWVIRALNDDLPYDQFVKQQLAADLLPTAADPRSLAALGFVTVGGHFMNNVHDIFDDRIDVVTRGLLGLTVTCARCHDHKYDPIPQADYYSLYGVFRSCSEPVVPPAISRVPETEEFEYFELELISRRKRLDEFLAHKHTELVSGARTRVAEYLLAAYASRDQPSTEDFMLLIPEGDLHPTVVQRYWLYLQRTRKEHDPVWAPWHALGAIPEAEFAARSPIVCAELAAAGDPQKPLNRLVVQALSQNPPQSLKETAERYGRLLGEVARDWEAALQQAADTKQPAPTALPDPDREQLRNVFYAPDAPANVPIVTGWGVLTLLPDRAAQAEYQKLIKDLETWLIRGPQAPARAMVLADDAVPYAPRVFLRGNPNRTGETVARKSLAVLSDNPVPFQQGSGRLELAQAIVSPDNPLTPRVLVNRAWLHHFGAGLVKTPGDFGLRSDPPSHPELLDHLALDFIETGWSLKQLHRKIMLSAVYQQSSTSPPDSAATIDPENRLLWHMPRRRVDFEGLRDSLLAVAGTLDAAVGGPPVNLITGSNRRTVYGFIDRLALPGLLRTFDFPSPDTTAPVRDSTTVAPQALYLMNGAFAQECARRILTRSEIAGEQNIARRVEALYRLLFSRAPTRDEVALAVEFVGLGTAGMADTVDSLVVAPDSNTIWERYIHALLLTNEFVFID